MLGKRSATAASFAATLIVVDSQLVPFKMSKFYVGTTSRCTGQISVNFVLKANLCSCLSKNFSSMSLYRDTLSVTTSSAIFALRSTSTIQTDSIFITEKTITFAIFVVKMGAGHAKFLNNPITCQSLKFSRVKKNSSNTTRRNITFAVDQSVVCWYSKRVCI